jgi:hypothetical protein
MWLVHRHRYLQIKTNDPLEIELVSYQVQPTSQPTSQPLASPQTLVDQMTLPAAIGIGAILGAILRRGLLDLFSTPAGPVFAVLVPNMLGCFVMGFSQPFKTTLLAYYPPAFPTITTGNYVQSRNSSCCE